MFISNLKSQRKMSAINQHMSGSHDQQSQESTVTWDDVAAMFLEWLLTFVQSQKTQLTDHFQLPRQPLSDNLCSLWNFSNGLSPPPIFNTTNWVS